MGPTLPPVVLSGSAGLNSSGFAKGSTLLELAAAIKVPEKVMAALAAALGAEPDTTVDDFGFIPESAIYWRQWKAPPLPTAPRPWGYTRGRLSRYTGMHS